MTRPGARDSLKPVLVAAAALAGSAVGAVGGAVFGGWLVARWLDGVEVTARGVRVGPPWALIVPWHAVRGLGFVRVNRAVEVWVATDRGVATTGTVPPVLVPAVRARIRRLGGLALTEGTGGPGGVLDLRYARWQPAAAGIPWGVGLGVLVADGEAHSTDAGVRQQLARMAGVFAQNQRRLLQRCDGTR